MDEAGRKTCSHSEGIEVIIRRPAECLQHCGGPNRNGSYGDHVMAKAPLPSPEVLRQLLRYEPETGMLFWRERPRSMFSSCSRHRGWNTRCAGKLALSTKHSAGYRCGPINNKLLLAHRVIMAIQNGEWPEGEVDHVNGDRADNRLSNLRCVPHEENARNRCLSGRNTSGAMGVWWHKANRCWIAEITHDGIKQHIGSFTVKEDALRARRGAEQKLGFHRNHGRP